MPLHVAVGYSTQTGPRERNEDFCSVATPDGLELESKGMIAAVADGLGEQKGGREAAEFTVRGLLADYFATPDTWGVPRAIETVVSALNRWVIAEGGRNPVRAGMATTLSALVLRGRRFYTAHVGDTRIYRLAGGILQQLTVDHLWDHHALNNVLSRAVGLDTRLLLDFGDGELSLGDRFLLVSDGVWNVLANETLQEVLLNHPEPQAAASALASLAIAQGGDDNASAVVVDVLALPAQNLRDSLENAAHLRLPPRLKPGQQLDGFEVEAILHDARDTLLYRVRDLHNGEQWVMKTLQPGLAGNLDAAAALLMEEWRARRVLSPCFPRVIPTEQRSCLYYLMTWHPGATLQARLDSDQHFSVGDVVRLGSGLLKAIAALHRLDIVHRDIRAANIHIGQDGVLRLLDLSLAVSRGDFAGADPGSPVASLCHAAPEQFDDAAPEAAHDLYAAGVTLYHLLTRKYPYGEIQSAQRPRFGEPDRPSRWRAEVPGWLENILLKAVAPAAKDRFETAEEFLLALERGASRPLAAPGRRALAERNPVLFWRLIAVASILGNFILGWTLIR